MISSIVINQNKVATTANPAVHSKLVPLLTTTKLLRFDSPNATLVVEFAFENTLNPDKNVTELLTFSEDKPGA